MDGICAMKGGARLAQSLCPQDPEKIGFFNDFSRPLEADSASGQKRDSRLFSDPPEARFLPRLSVNRGD
jgi:hypothetical protein